MQSSTSSTRLGSSRLQLYSTYHTPPTLHFPNHTPLNLHKYPHPPPQNLHHTPTMSPSPIFLLLLLLTTPFILSLQPQCTTSSPSPSTSSSTSFIPSPPFISTVQSTLSQITSLISTISAFTTPFLPPNTRLSSAISDCLDLLSLSSDELSSSTSPAPKGTGNHQSDVHAYVSAALSNQDTCQESVSSTNSLLGNLISSGLASVNSLVSDLLRQLPSSPSQRQLWVPSTKWDESMVNVRVDCVVAKDGSGNFTTVQEAVEKAPEESEGRFVIYVKRGVYKENVEVKKKKWNVMLIGDGIDVTVITGSRSFVDGWTTYRSSTVGKCTAFIIGLDAPHYL